MTSRRWTGTCYRCHRQREVQSRPNHAMQVLCDDCAGQPHRPPRAVDADFEEPAVARPTGRRSGKLPGWTPDEGDPAERYVAWLNELWGLDNGRDPFVAGERFGRHGDATIVLIRASGRRVRWTHQATLQKPAGLQGVLMSECGIKPRKLSGYDAMLIAWAITQLADLKSDIDPTEEVVLWWSRYVDSRPVEHADPDDEAQWRAALVAWQQAARADERRKFDEDRRTFILVDSRDDTRYIRREDFAQHVRQTVAGSMSWATLNSRVSEAGWQQDRFQRRATPSAPYVQVRVYCVPAGWPDGA